MRHPARARAQRFATSGVIAGQRLRIRRQPHNRQERHDEHRDLRWVQDGFAPNSVKACHALPTPSKRWKGAIVDPYGISRWIDRPGFNAYKPAHEKHVRLFKAFDVSRIRPRAIVIETSR